MYSNIDLATLKKALENLESRTDRSAWDRGVTAYSRELLGDVIDDVEGGYYAAPQTRAEFERAAMNGAETWRAYSYSACALFYDCDIAERLCTPSELKKKRGGELNPNSRETWLDTQARALFQAAGRAWKAVRGGQHDRRVNGLYSTRAAAMEEARGDECVVKVCGGWKIMNVRDYQIRTMQK